MITAYVIKNIETGEYFRAPSSSRRYWGNFPQVYPTVKSANKALKARLKRKYILSDNPNTRIWLPESDEVFANRKSQWVIIQVEIVGENI